MGSVGACITTVIAEITVTITQLYFVRKFLNIPKLIKSVLIFFPPAVLMLIAVRFVGINMGARILTTMVQISVGGLIYVVALFIFFRVFYKQNIIVYLKSMIKN
ncbi:hypothetical protein D3C81_1794220 [compost metagenome]